MSILFNTLFSNSEINEMIRIFENRKHTRSTKRSRKKLMREQIFSTMEANIEAKTKRRRVKFLMKHFKKIENLSVLFKGILCRIRSRTYIRLRGLNWGISFEKCI